jgi:hypothetical protein
MIIFENILLDLELCSNEQMLGSCKMLENYHYGSDRATEIIPENTGGNIGISTHI